MATRQRAVRSQPCLPFHTAEVTADTVRASLGRKPKPHRDHPYWRGAIAAHREATGMRLTLDEWRRVLATNLDGVYLCTRAVWPALVARGYGRIVNISSATFHIGYPEMVPYISSKGGIVGFTRGLAAEAGAHGITVNCITPGLIETEGTQVEDPTGELFEEIVAGQAVKRRGRPEDIAECIAYLASAAAGFITGQTINVDGGHRLH